MQKMTVTTKTVWVLTAMSMSFLGLSVGFVFGNANLAGAKGG